ncbi:hypothetical protein PT283_09640 [Acetobacteraceae bacterium ESL0697]|nr:hypothetical protein [Acetobacteraceae bacterium ESL0697]
MFKGKSFPCHDAAFHDVGLIKNVTINTQYRNRGQSVIIQCVPVIAAIRIARGQKVKIIRGNVIIAGINQCLEFILLGQSFFIAFDT